MINLFLCFLIMESLKWKSVQKSWNDCVIFSLCFFFLPSNGVWNFYLRLLLCVWFIAFNLNLFSLFWWFVNISFILFCLKNFQSLKLGKCEVDRQRIFEFFLFSTRRILWMLEKDLCELKEEIFVNILSGSQWTLESFQDYKPLISLYVDKVFILKVWRKF